ncbi:MAG: 16S rRNA (uracil(1498)-N(3))-methyltransferase [Frankiaceae bacterium]|nr:16S rRNA (uracil(1498)-N(3))-methyltransferase [Frankiaceae bacterium]
MTAPVFLADGLESGRVVLAGPEGRHAATVRRVQPGEAVDLVDGRGMRASCTVVSVGRDVVELDVLRRTTEQQAAPRLVLVQAIAKGDRGELAVELATEVGIDAIVPWSAARCVVKWDGERGAKALARWRSTAREATKQSRRSWLPHVHEPHTTAQVVELLGSAEAGLVLHEAATRPLAGLELPGAGDVVLVVGPEGGIRDEELAAFEAVGATAVRLGASVLRTSTAGAAAAAVVSARTARWA